jgi:hypothetical protein
MSRQPEKSYPLGWLVRCSLLVAAAGLMGLLAIAIRLEPDPRGFGTHTQLGLGPCAYLTSTGRLCPTCGMTTAYAWVVRGNLGRSWQANPAGCLFALLSVPLAAWLITSAALKHAAGFQSLEKPLSAVILAAAILGVGSWSIRSLTRKEGVKDDPSTFREPQAHGRADRGRVRTDRSDRL